MAFNMIRRAAVLACGVVAVAGAGSAQAALINVTDYNAFVLGSYTGLNSDVQGRIAAGGSVSLNNYGVGSSLGTAANGTNTLVVGGAFSGNNGQLFKGNAVVGGASATNGFTIANGSLTKNTTVPIDFAAEGVFLNALADTLGAMSATGGSQFQYGTMKLTGANSGLNIFTVSAADLSKANNFQIFVPKGAQVLVNVKGADASMQNMGFGLNGLDATNVLLNFYEATDVKLGGIGIYGSVLAPGAAVKFNNGQLNGLLVAASFHGTGELHNVGYKGGLLDAPKTAVPEPATWAMMIAGFGLVGGAMRRSRAAKAVIA
ncbi:hypothetical protein ACFB49_43190 [Sphingomonas sp. DBB INV C78]|uniref:collagen-binding domain-containing protein n=1 Tax=Sphingomonas sp. DBB INV C78 TaxID=3349434 RepID=UPI0036D359D8